MKILILIIFVDQKHNPFSGISYIIKRNIFYSKEKSLTFYVFLSLFVLNNKGDQLSSHNNMPDLKFK